MFVSKPGKDHITFDLNNQDAGFCELETKCVNDGCGQGKHSEVGAKLFSFLMQKAVVNNKPDSSGKRSVPFNDMIAETYAKLINIFGVAPDDVKNYLSFTSLFVFKETEVANSFLEFEGLGPTPSSKFITKTCGDGFIILQDLDGKFLYEEAAPVSPAPEYFIYNFINKKYLKSYQEGVSYRTTHYPGGLFRNVGIATDGLRYLLDPKWKHLLEEFESYLTNDEEVKLRRFLNRHRKILKDDITLAW